MFGFLSPVFLFFLIAGIPVAKSDNGFDDARSKEECTGALLNLVTPKGEITCDEMFDWSVCAARVLGFDAKTPTNDDINTFDIYLKEILKLISLECTFNINNITLALTPSSTIHEPVDPMTISTKEQLAYSTPATGPVYSENKGCLQYTNGACSGRPDGNYPVCFPMCQSGYYITCSNYITTIRTCPDGWYQPKNKPPPEGRYTAPLVYSSFWDMCLEASPDCPRDHDSQIENKK